MATHPRPEYVAPGKGFERHLAELATLTPVQLDDAAFIRELGERYDIWPESS